MARASRLVGMVAANGVADARPDALLEMMQRRGSRAALSTGKNWRVEKDPGYVREEEPLSYLADAYVAARFRFGADCVDNRSREESFKLAACTKACSIPRWGRRLQ